MQIDLPTLWYLTCGTLLVGAAMTAWESWAQERRGRELAIWTGSYLVFALGCVVAVNREALPGIAGSALTNLLMVLGYLAVLHGARRLDGPPPLRGPAALLAVLALAWTVAGAGHLTVFWHHVAAVPIALVCGLTAWTLLRSRALASLRSRPVAVAIFAVHTLFYLVRALVTPVLVAFHGSEVLPAVAKITMFEAVLFAMAMPMALLALVREEAQGSLLAAARTDHLTGLGNRHGFFAEAGRVLAGHGPDRPVTLLAFDLDHFKTINDRHGHAAGDRVLALFAEVVRAGAGPGAVLGRLGGEEFAALLPGHDIRAARRIGDGIARGFTETIARADALGMPATVSIGAAEARTGRADLAHLLASADRALYRAKALGRNRVEIAEPGSIAAAA